MADILHEVVIGGAPEQVYTAITEQAGLSKWWTVKATAKPEVGSVSEFAFMGGAFVIRARVSALEPNRHVGWDQVQGAPDWGSVCTWDLTPQDGSTKVLFAHRGYASTDGSYPATNYNWGWYLTSLKAYCETGAGMPHDT